jgi:hypothetical protein
MPEERPIYFNPMEVRGIDDALRIAEKGGAEYRYNLSAWPKKPIRF